jgi:long-chain acyl-CoA synthetase
MDRHLYSDILKKSLRDHGAKACMHVKRNGVWQTWTYGDFRRDLNRCVSALKKVITRADTDMEANCVVIGDNTPEWVIAWHSGFLSGGRTVPVDPNLPAAEIREIVLQTRPHIVFCSRAFDALFEELARECDHIRRIVILDDSFPEKDRTFSSFLELGAPDEDAFARRFLPDDPAVIIFTSGTTGKAKGVVLTQRNFTAISLYALPRMNAGPSDTMMAVLPLHHVFGACACLGGALGGGLDIVLIPTVKGSLILEGLREKKVSLLPAVPKLLSLFYNNLRQNVKAKGIAVRMLFSALTFLSMTLGGILGMRFRKMLFSSVHNNFGGRLRIIISGGAALQKKYFNGFHRMGFAIVEGYGLSETFGAITLCPLAPRRFGTVGIPLAENEVRIDNPDSAGTGEVCFRGTNVFRGYYNNDELTKKVFDERGWFHTGDLGRIDRDGFIHLVGRIKDVIVLDSGKNVYPDELEDFYSSSGIIEEIGVFSAMLKGREIAAALILPSQEIRKNNTLVEATDIVRNEVLRLGRDLPSYKKITDFAVVFDPLPQTTTKKLKKHELREIYYSVKESDGDGGGRKPPQASAMELSLMETEVYRSIASFAAKLSKRNLSVPQILPHFLLEIDLGLDSLKQIDMICMVEQKYKIVFPEEQLVRIETMGDMYHATVELLEEAATAEAGETVCNIRQRIMSGAGIPPLPSNPAAAFSSIFPQILHSVSTALWNVSVSGVNGLASDKPLVFCANRQSRFDPLWILYSLPPPLRNKTFIIGTREIKTQFMTGPLGSHIIPLDRDHDAVAILRLSITALTAGNNLLVFPEAGATVTGELRKFKSGVGFLVLESNATVVPVRIKGTLEVWPAGGMPRLPGRTKSVPTITFGAQLTYQSLIEAGGITPYSTADQIAACIRDCIATLHPQ